LQITLLLGKLSLFSKELLLLVVFDEANVALSQQDVALLFDSLLAVSFGNPLSFKHLSFGGEVNLVRVLARGLGLLLPVKNCKSVSVQLCLLLGLSDLTFELLLGVEGIELGVDLLFEHALLNLTAFINKLLLTLDLGAHNVEF